MAKAYTIETVFKLIDQVTAPTSRVGKALDKLGIKSKAVSNALKRDFDKAAARIDRLGASIKKWLGRAVLGGIAAIGIGLGVVTKQFVEFDSQLHKAGSIFSDLNPLADDFKTKLDAIGKAARDVAAATEFNAEETARALATMAQAGIKSEQAIALLPKVADMATAAGVDLDQAVGMAAGALNVFGKMTDDPLKLAENLQYVSDVMVKGANLANMSLSDMSASVSTGGAMFKEANQRVEDYIAAIDILASVNRTGAEAGKAVSAMMTRLAAKPGDVSKALQELGVRTQDAQGNMLNFIDIMGQLNVAMNGMGTAKKSEYLYRIFGQNRIEYARPLVDAGVEGFRAYSQELENAAGSTAQVAEVMRQSIKNKLAILGSAATEMGFKFVEAFKDKAVTAIESATTAIDNFDVAPLVEMAGAAASGIMKFAGILAGVVKIAWKFRYVIVAILAPIAAYNLALMGITIVMGIYHKWHKIIMAAKFLFVLATNGQTAALALLTKGTIAHTVAQKAFALISAIQAKVTAILTGIFGAQTIATASMAVASGTATAAQWALNAAMYACPVLLIVGLIGLLIFAIVKLVQNWDDVSDAVVLFGWQIRSYAIKPVEEFLKLLSKIPFLTGKFDEAIEQLQFDKKLTSEKIREIEERQRIRAEKKLEEQNPMAELDKQMAELNKQTEAAEKQMAELEEQMKAYDYPGFGIPGIGLVPGTGGRSKLHGVVDISGGAIPGIDSDGTYTTTSAVDNASAPGTSALAAYVIGIAATLQRIEASVSVIAYGSPGVNYTSAIDNTSAPGTSALAAYVIGIAATLQKIEASVSVIAYGLPATGTATSALTSCVVSIAATLQRIEASVSGIARSLPPELPAITAPGAATRTSTALPRVNMGGGDNGGDYHNPRDIPPVTQYERMAYSFEERRQTIVIEVTAEKGTAARIVRAPRDVDIQLVKSGGNA